ncbi:glycine cleavage system aminomethyltransferase GcvT [candidate division WOR-3 bacterium]|nr:glycine cleavage system aminomethyltransferase GcvT [candidate division WOR-3 bacterium]
MVKRTPFYEKHREAGGKIVPFAGFEMPIQYKGIIQEVKQVRTKAGIFDVSHMGRVEVKGGPQALEFISQITVNDPSRLEIRRGINPRATDFESTEMYQAQYSCMCYPDGGIVDDILIYRFPDKFLIVINAANRDKDWNWILEHKIDGAEIIDVSNESAQLAIQGPDAESVVQPLVDIDLSEMGFYWGANCKVAGIPAFVSRTGYTGENGFELYFDSKHSEIWDKLLNRGAEPVGLGARDVLRLEMKYCLYGNDIDKTTTPLEAGLGWITKLDKPSFIGKDVLVKQKEEGVKRKLVSFIMEGMKVIPRQHYKIYSPQSLIGEVTSGNYSPSIDRLIGLGYVEVPYNKIDTEIEIECRGKLESAKIIKPPFYKHGTRK